MKGIYIADNGVIVCPFCGEYGMIEKFQSKMNNEIIYRCNECLGIYESLVDLEYNVQTQHGSGYAEMIGIEDFDTDAVDIGPLRVGDLAKYKLTFKKYTIPEDVHANGKAYLDNRVFFSNSIT